MNEWFDCCDSSVYRKSILLWPQSLTLKTAITTGQWCLAESEKSSSIWTTTVAVNLKGVSDKQLAVIHRSIWGLNLKLRDISHWIDLHHQPSSCSWGLLAPIVMAWFCVARGQDIECRICCLFSVSNKMVKRNFKISLKIKVCEGKRQLIRNRGKGGGGYCI